MSGDLQTRKRRGKAKKKDDADDDILDGKARPVVNNSHKSNGGGGGEGSGIVAKVIFLILLVSLSIVIGLILIELRGKDVGMEKASVVPRAEEQAAPEIPTPSIHVDEEPGPEAAAAPILEAEIEEDFEPLEATPPLEEYIKIVDKEAPLEKSEEPVEEVIEVIEEIPVEIIEEAVEVVAAAGEEEEEEEVVAAPDEEVEAVEVLEEPTPEDVEEPAPVEEVMEAAVVEETEAAVPVEEVEEAAPVEEVEEAAEVVEEAAPAEVIEATPEEEIKEAAPAEEAAPTEEVEEAAPVEEVEEAALEEEVEEAAPAEEVEEAAPAEEVEEAAPAEEVEEAAPAVEIEEAAPAEEVEEPAAVEEVEEIAPVEEVEEQAVEEVEEPAVEEPIEVAAVTEEPAPAEPVVEEPVVVETVEEVEAPAVVEESIPAPAEEEEDEEEKEDTSKEEAEEESAEDDEDDEDKDDEEEEEEKKVRLPPMEDDDDDIDWSQYGKEGGAAALTDAYLRVEALAEEVLRLDPENSMVNHLAPHLSGVLRAMEEGRTEGLLDTLSHIQVILEDVKTRIEEPSRDTPAVEAPAEAEEPNVEAPAETAEPTVEAPSEAAEPTVEAPSEAAEPTVEAPSEAVEPAVEAPSEVAEPEPEPEPAVETETIAEAVAQPPSEEESIGGEVEAPAVAAEEVVVERIPERERLFPLDPVEESEEKVLADIEEQIVSHEEVAAVEKEDIPIPSITEADTVSSPEEAEEGGEPVPVDEVIPDPVHIEPLQEQSPSQEGAESAYEKADITSNVDNELREDLDAAEKLIPENLRDALNSFGAILQKNPKSARALYGRAMCLDRLAEVERSNSKLEQAIVTYRGVIDLADEDSSLVPLPLLRLAADKCIDRMRFRGFFGKAVRVQQRLMQRFPDDLDLRNQMGVTFLLMNQPTAAKEVFETILEKWPQDGFAQVHYGFILKTTYGNNTGGAEYMKKGIDSQMEGTQDGRFYFHLGDALQREGKNQQAYEVYDTAVGKGLFLNRYQRSLYNVDRLSSQPVWSLEETPYTEFFRKLEANWEAIRDEGVALLSEPPQDGYRPEAENLQDTGDWKQYALFARGRKITANCVKAKVTCSLIEDYPPAANCKRGQVKFSVMQPNTHVHPHAGPTNCRLRAHLGLVVPSGVQLRIAEQQVRWEEGKIIIFDDSWEHEVWHNGTTDRLVLIVDVWHPDLTDHEKKTLSPL